MYVEEYHVTGMNCAACVAHVEHAVSSVSGVNEVNVSLLTNSMQVQGNADVKDIVAAVKKAGYGAEKVVESDDESILVSDLKDHHGKKKKRDTEFFAMIKRLMVSVCVLLPLMYISMGHMLFSWPLPSLLEKSPAMYGGLEFLLTLIVCILNRKFFINGIGGVFHLNFNMDTLVALGSGVSFIYSTYLYIHILQQGISAAEQMKELMNSMYFDSAAMILVLKTKKKTLKPQYLILSLTL